MIHNASNYFKMAWKTKMQTEEKNNETISGRSKRRNCLRKCFHSFKYIISSCKCSLFLNRSHKCLLFLLSKLLTLLCVIPSVLLAASSQIVSQVYTHKNFYLNTYFFLSNYNIYIFTI